MALKKLFSSKRKSTPPTLLPGEGPPTLEPGEGPPTLEPSEDHLLQLREFDIVLLVDDSGSMWKYWEATRSALEALATVAARLDEDGIEIHFMNSKKSLTTSEAEEVSNLFAKVKPDGATPLGGKITMLLESYMRILSSKPDTKKCLYLILTDGKPTDDPKTENSIVWTAKQLDHLNASSNQIGIQFVQIGDDPGATKFLQDLDDGLKHKAGVRDMVDTTLAGTDLDLIKILLGAVNRRVDVKGSSVFQKAT